MDSPFKVREFFPGIVPSRVPCVAVSGGVVRVSRFMYYVNHPNLKAIRVTKYKILML